MPPGCRRARRGGPPPRMGAGLADLALAHGLQQLDAAAGILQPAILAAAAASAYARPRHLRKSPSAGRPRDWGERAGWRDRPIWARMGRRRAGKR